MLFVCTGVKATYLLAVSFLEITRFSSNGGILNGSISVDASRSAISCVFEYLKTPNLVPAVLQCLTALVHRAYETAVSWLVRYCFMKYYRPYYHSLLQGILFEYMSLVFFWINVLKSCNLFTIFHLFCTQTKIGHFQESLKSKLEMIL